MEAVLPTQFLVVKNSDRNSARASGRNTQMPPPPGRSCEDLTHNDSLHGLVSNWCQNGWRWTLSCAVCPANRAVSSGGERPASIIGYDTPAGRLAERLQA